MTEVQPDPENSRARHWKRLVAAVLVLTTVALVVVLVLPLFRPHDDLGAVAFPDDSHGWALADTWDLGGTNITGGAIYATTDGGLSWHKQESASTWSSPAAMAFANARVGWMVGSLNNEVGPVLLATTDGGSTWHRQGTGAFGTADSLSDIACAGATHAWAVGAADGHEGLIFATSDGGATWRRQAPTRSGWLNAVAFADARHGWAVGWGVILGTTDGGRTWKQQGSVKPYYLESVVCVGPCHAWAIGEDDQSMRDAIIATSDGGAIWKVQYSSTSVALHAIAFADVTHGWAVGVGGVILATTDGGTSWHPKRSGTTMNLRDVAFADSTHGLVVGDQLKGSDPMAAQFAGSIVLRTTDGGVTWVK